MGNIFVKKTQHNKVKKTYIEKNKCPFVIVQWHQINDIFGLKMCPNNIYKNSKYCYHHTFIKNKT